MIIKPTKNPLKNDEIGFQIVRIIVNAATTLYTEKTTPHIIEDHEQKKSFTAIG